MGEPHVNMNITLDGVFQANGGPSAHDGDVEYAGWEAPYGDQESNERLVVEIQGSDALLLGHTTYDNFRGHCPVAFGPRTRKNPACRPRGASGRRDPWPFRPVR
ncbi:hypothetical protein GCM10009715_06380 [Paeniglutamicibacter psychrophenolicus]|uniref:Bacterial bifunctional deaminase-reductase C-terminal domain-containing protein n=1 Tax=Paeniglutamicibacter psychrophenolicus TaxID=257454 RepID=A0ABS4WGQ0_9MICC|nr:hypothetical protein [Paeniglutamicibacter psychrophenolicus]MBP2375389.1 hypothetical protein [Paeniglutamicibacter psychrophenolicus]